MHSQANRGTRAEVDIKIARFHLPPVESVLAVGRRAPIGAKAMAKALEEMLPGRFHLIGVENHDTIEALLINVAHVKRIPEEKLVALVLRQVEPLMDDTEMLHVTLDIHILSQEVLDL